MTVEIWFTRGLSTIGDAISMMRVIPLAQDLSFMASHVEADNPVQQAADEFVQEPIDLNGPDDARWVLETAIRHQVALIVVQRKPDAIWASGDEVAAQGVRVQIAATPDVQALLDDMAQILSHDP